MKAVMLSIQPKWCELIASGRKTIEVRKTRPQVETPFKCYIYCTQNEFLARKSNGEFWFAKRDTLIQPNDSVQFSGKVIGEFICNEIMPVMSFCSEPNSITPHELPFIGMTDKEVIEYLGNGKEGYGWHISDLKVYDNPKKLCEFRKHCNHFNDCCTCERSLWDKYDSCFEGCDNKFTRPPQSWCYVEEQQAR